MKHLLGRSGLRHLRDFAAGEILYAFDYDGTLAPIAADPAAAVISPRVSALLTELAARAPTLVISGRAVADLNGRVPLARERLIGNHGLEGSEAGKRRLGAARAICESWWDQLAEISAVRAVRGVLAEDKTYSLALHYRQARNKARTREILAKAAYALTPAPRIILGKCVINLLPPDAPNKGTALLEALARFGVDRAIYVGDDDTDEDVFGLSDARILKVRVGRKRTSHAEFYLERQADIAHLLARLVETAAPNPTDPVAPSVSSGGIRSRSGALRRESAS